ncbi:hypothetical protein [Dyadobacter chenhuakuii]|uniref:Uncharacterized protein n=1 Tax=Dyadobacter chenhuakuii TaxID=2909339 RepID=A0ABY4XLK5_9BACT|nr:hypothetical protein [Dyadobacter chenhuakuii]MCF2494137.1 hypothetical protein [Dyadobacter chenhuakuii]USJ31265.1 hypothetical protein NFI80_00705 [Dyadobacter chenhuakuii]
MDHTDVGNATDIINGMGSPHHQLADRLIAAPHRDYALMKGSGNLYSTASDLSKWNMAEHGSGHFNKMVTSLNHSSSKNGKPTSNKLGCMKVFGVQAGMRAWTIEWNM